MFVALEANGTALLVDQTGDASQERRFTCAISPHEGNALAAVHLNIKAVQCLQVAVEGIKT